MTNSRANIINIQCIVPGGLPTGYDSLGSGFQNQIPTAPPPPYDFNFGSQTFGAPPPPPLATTGQYVSAPPLRQNGNISAQPYSYGRPTTTQTTIHIARPLGVPISTYHRKEDSDCCCCCCTCPFWVCCLLMALVSIFDSHIVYHLISIFETK